MPSGVYNDQPCERCGRHIGLKQKRQRFCSRLCKNEWFRETTVDRNAELSATALERGTWIEVSCVGCQNTFRTQTKREPTKYCSMECKLKHKRANMIRVCRRCGKTFLCSKGNRGGYHGKVRFYCSRECHIPGHIGKQTYSCQGCFIQFEAYSGRNGTPRLFCSKKCSGPLAGLTSKCLVCDTDFQTKERPHPKLNGHVRRQRFCSKSCMYLYRGPSWPEEVVRQALRSLSVPFVEQFRCGRYSIDFYLPDLNVALEVDGDYWHSVKGDRDQRRDKWVFENRAIRTIRIQENSIRAARSVLDLVASKLGLKTRQPFIPGLLDEIAS